jgi:hypothetical protein
LRTPKNESLWAMYTLPSGPMAIPAGQMLDWAAGTPSRRGPPKQPAPMPDTVPTVRFSASDVGLGPTVEVGVPVGVLVRVGVKVVVAVGVSVTVEALVAVSVRVAVLVLVGVRVAVAV